MEGEEHWTEPQLIRRNFHHLTLDTNTANRLLLLSEDNSKVTWDFSARRDPPDHPDRFDYCPQILCTEGLTGQCYWEVEWSKWVHIAVTYRGIKRKGLECKLGWNDKSWSLSCEDGLHGNRYSVIHNRKHTLPVRPSDSKRVGVYLDTPAGTLSFYRVSSDTLTHLYTFKSTFTEPLYPAFWLTDNASVSLCQIKLSSDEVDQSNMDITSYTPSVNTEHTTNKYSYDFPRAGLFECDQSGLVFGTTGEGEVLYRTVQWENEKLRPTGMAPAGPLFSIKCHQRSINQLRLPHFCITPDDDLSVANITDKGEMEILKPQEVTQTHVVVNGAHLSICGIVRRIKKLVKSTKSQLLLFRQPPRGQRQILSIYLLPSNVPLREVKVHNKEDEHIKTTSFCVLTPDQRYSLQCTSYKVQPQGAKYQLDYGPNYHATFMVTTDLEAEDITLTLLDPEKRQVWQQEDIVLGRHWALEAQSKGPSASVSAKHFVDQHRCFLIENVTMVKPILDLLLDEGVITQEGYDDVLSQSTNQNKMRQLYTHLTSRNAKDIFYKGLEKHEKFLLKDLMGRMGGRQEPMTEDQEVYQRRRRTHCCVTL